jgi:protein involved in polysaccharide export with SLBB domain
VKRLLLGCAFILAAAGQALALDTGLGGFENAVRSIGGAQPAVEKVTRQQPPAPDPQAASPRDDSREEVDSDVFGANLFTGAFARMGGPRFSPDYVISSGDLVQVRLWGAFAHDEVLTVDPKGNIFLPHVGPVQLRGVRNSELQGIVETAVRQEFKANVNSYASLAAAQPVRVFVGGFVEQPGLYGGTSTDSLLHYLDQAGGIDLERGSFLKVQVKRDGKVRTTVNLYDFLLRGKIPFVQLADGDVVFVESRRYTVKVNGLAKNAKRFEFFEPRQTAEEVMALARPFPSATHVRIVRNSGPLRSVEYFPLEDAANIEIFDGDEVEFTSDKRPGTITVRVEGEHDSPKEYVLAYGTRLGELLQKIELTDRSDGASMKLYRRSIQERQKASLEASLKSLESAALTARSGTSDEARLRREEADLILQWVDRARDVEPSGLVVIAQTQARTELLLENSDVIRIPKKDGLVLVSGEVLFPTAVAFDAQLALVDYIRQAGGFTQNAESARIIVAHRDGSFSEADAKSLDKASGAARDNGPLGEVLWWTDSPDGERYSDSIRPGDEILVLPRIDVKSRQITKDLTQIIYQIAVSAGVVLGL